MGRYALQVFTDPADIAKLERWVAELAVNACVRVHVASGPAVEGIVAVTPTVQVFEDADGNEGLNGIVKLEDAQRPDWDGIVWLGDIVQVEHLDAVTWGTSRA